MRFYFIFGLALVLVLFYSNDLKADRRYYAWTYQYGILEKGTAELEYYNTISAPDVSNMKGNTVVEQMVEAEIGMTEHFDFSIYQVFSQQQEQSIRYEGFKLRARYKFSEKGKLFIDPLFYIEYIGNPDFTKQELEAKLILSKDIGVFNISFNPILAIEKEEKEVELKPEYALGMNYELARTLRIGIEFKGSKDGHYIAPVISHGMDKIWVALAPTFKLGSVKNGQPGFFLRLLVGLEISH